MTRVRGPWEATPAGQAISMAMASVRLLVADAYRLGQNFGQEDLSVPFSAQALHLSPARVEGSCGLRPTGADGGPSTVWTAHHAELAAEFRVESQ